MSNQPHYCERCKREGQCDAVVSFAQGGEDVFAVSWKCPGCGERSLVVSPIGPLLAPEPGTCLQCGHQVGGEGQPCPACGTLLSEVLSSDEQARPEAALLQTARDCFALGTCRRGLTIVNLVLRRNPASREAWSIKGQFLGHLRFTGALRTTMQEAARRTGAGQAEGGRTRDKRRWQFWK
jgi:hypothetical protein